MAVTLSITCQERNNKKVDIYVSTYNVTAAKLERDITSITDRQQMDKKY